MPDTRFIGLTGGIGSGKSTVRSIIAEMGIPTLDLDQVGKDLLISDSSLTQRLVTAFGKKILLSDNSLNRKALAKIAFKCKENTDKLNAIMHPAIRDFEEKWRKQQTSPLACIEASVLIEAKAYSRMDTTVVVIADLALRRERVLQRGLHDNSAFDAIIQRQCSDQERMIIADFVIYNNSSIKQLTSETRNLISRLQSSY